MHQATGWQRIRRSFEGRDIDEAQDKAVKWLLGRQQLGDEIMITNVGMDYIWQEVR